jgi:aminoglycoside 6'-N-acetyltransferase I
MTAIVPAGEEHLDGWAALRHLLWDDEPASVHRAEAEEQLADPQRYCNLVAVEDGEVVGFAEGTLRHDYVNGCDTSPVVFLEGICVAPRARRQGLARQLVAAIADWGRAKGCLEFASDTWLENDEGLAFHLAAGFVETGRTITFRQSI